MIKVAEVVRVVWVIRVVEVVRVVRVVWVIRVVEVVGVCVCVVYFRNKKLNSFYIT